MSTARPHELAARALQAALAEPEAEPTPEVEELAGLAAGRDSAAAVEASRALFGGLVEPLADRFDASLARAYIRNFARVLDRCRRREEFRHFDRELLRCGLASEADLAGRALRLREERPPTLDAARLRRVVVLSRVTVGADVAVVSVVVGRVRAAAPQAEIVLAGAPKAASLFAANRRLRLARIDYPRRGPLAERLESWLRLVHVVEGEAAGLGEGEFAVIDSDSRLTQLGLLPLGIAHRPLLFDSLGSGGDSTLSLAELADRWLRSVLGGPAQVLPAVDLAADELAAGKRLRARLGAPLAVVNFGVGGNAAKRAPEPFETRAVLALLRRGWRVALDRGDGADEERRAGAIAVAVGAAGFRAGSEEASAADAQLWLWRGSISALGGLVAAADLYLGYDSAGGHLAAAVGAPAVVVFRGAASPRMQARWRPWGARPAELLTAAPTSTAAELLAALEARL